jgi:hypothetical protein
MNKHDLSFISHKAEIGIEKTSDRSKKRDFERLDRILDEIEEEMV